MNQFTIRDIENLSGIKAHTLRMWEQRYNFMTPKRKESNHRFYDNDDLKQILRISYLYHAGIKISKIARLNNEEIVDEIAGKKSENEADFIIAQLMEASLDFDEIKFEEIINNALQLLDLEQCIIQIVYPYLEKIGLLWVTENLIPAQEHFSSNIVKRKILVAIDGLKQKPTDTAKIVLLFSPPHDHHEIPLLFIQYLLKKNGTRVVYFGDSINVTDIETYCSQKTVTHIHFHLITNFTEKDLNIYLAELSQRFAQYKIIMSGPTVKTVNTCPTNVRLLTSFQETLDYTREV